MRRRPGASWSGRRGTYSPTLDVPRHESHPRVELPDLAVPLCRSAREIRSRLLRRGIAARDGLTPIPEASPMHHFAVPARRAGRPITLAMLAVIAACMFASAPSSAIAQQPRVVSDSQAAQYVGQTVTVEGTVAQVSVSRRSNTTFLNFGQRYPHHTFTAVIFRSAAAQFPNPQQWEGKRVRVTGEVRLYQGRPEIVIEEPRQLALAP
jgi:hypothetical protein